MNIKHHSKIKQKDFGSDVSSGSELWDGGSDGFEGDDDSDSECFDEMLAHENNLTKAFWLPQEPYLYVITLGNHNICYDYEKAISRATG